jgi:ATP-dependent DNA helicase RecQ
VNYLVDVLLGKEDDRIRRFGHDMLSTFGIGDELNQGEWRSLFRQLIARGLLTADVEGHGSLSLTEASRPVLRGETKLMLRKQLKRKSRKTRSAGKEELITDPQARSLWGALRRKRQELAATQGVPAYVIFHDATLMAMLEQRPATLEQMGELSGIGARKLEAYGEIFLELLREHEMGE